MKQSSWSTVVLCIAFLSVSPLQAKTVESRESVKLHALFDAQWEHELTESPEFATMLGDDRYSDRWHDGSPQAVAKRKADRLELEQVLKKVNEKKISAEDRISLAIMRFQVRNRIELDQVYGDLPFSADDSPFAITQMGGVQMELTPLLRGTALKTVHDYEMLIHRLDTMPAMLDDTTARLRAGMRSGWMPAAIALQRVPSQFDPLLMTSLEKNPLFVPFTHFPASIVLSDQQRLSAAARLSIERRAIPALTQLQQFLIHDYLPAASQQIAATELPGKQAYYQARLTASNTTTLTPAEIHQIGLNEVAQIETAMLAVMQESGFKGSAAEFNLFMNSDPQFFFTSADAMLASYRDIAKRIDAQLPGQFVTLPRQPYGIRAMLPAEGDGPEHYTFGALDGSRAGFFEANVNNLKRRASWSMEDLVLHEAMPGHHLQIARASELEGLPTFRRSYRNSGYSEGWALYAESLGYDLGMYTTPYTRYGFLTSQMFRACRLVVDTGIHAFGLSRDEAIHYLMEHAAVTEAFATAEVDRYIVWPGQATAYKLGQLQILALRKKAEKALGTRFDVRQFNNQVVDHGGLPLKVLNDVIDQWIVAQH